MKRTKMMKPPANHPNLIAQSLVTCHLAGKRAIHFSGLLITISSAQFSKLITGKQLKTPPYVGQFLDVCIYSRYNFSKIPKGRFARKKNKVQNWFKTTLPETNSSSLKIDPWESPGKIPMGFPTHFLGAAVAVSVRGGEIFSNCPSYNYRLLSDFCFQSFPTAQGIFSHSIHAGHGSHAATPKNSHSQRCPERAGDRLICGKSGTVF